MNPDDFADFFLKERQKWDRQAIKDGRKIYELQRRVRWLESLILSSASEVDDCPYCWGEAQQHSNDCVAFKSNGRINSTPKDFK